MNPDTQHRPSETPPGGFEERLLSRILADYDQLTAAPVRPRRSTPRLRWASRRAQLGIAVPVLAAVVLVAVVILSSHGASRHVRAVPAVVHAQDTAYIVRRVRANLARLAVSGQGRVLERSGTIGDGTAADPVVNNVDWAYIDPATKVAYQRSVDRSADGTALSINRLVTTPVGNALHTQVTFVDPSRHAFYVAANAPPSGTVTAARSDTALGIRSSAHQIEQALAGNRVTQRATATVDGQSTIELSVPVPAAMIKAGLPAHTTITFYVNAHSYQPVQEVEASPAEHGSSGAGSISRWLPATRSTIALTKVRIPAGYRRMAGSVTDFWNATRPLFFIGC